jgi:hypothetical protein
MASISCAATSGSSIGVENCGLDRSRNTSGSRIRFTVRRSGPPSALLSTSTPSPIARHAWSIAARRGTATATDAATFPVLIASG